MIKNLYSISKNDIIILGDGNVIERKNYIKKLKAYKDKDIIKIVTGIRRCGKSTLFDLFIQELKKEKIKENQIIKINLENPDYDFKDYKELYHYVKSKLIDNKKNYVFLDEVQVVPEFQRAVNGLYMMKNVDLYITGSNAYLLSGELATLLSGRYIEINMLPLSFKEYISNFNDNNYDRLYLQYINRSSFPYAIMFENEDEIDDYIENIYNTIILKDVISRKKIADSAMLQSVTKFMLSNIGNLLSVKKIADTLTSDGRSISTHTVENYLQSLVESFIFYKATRFDVKGKQYLQSKEKYYVTDVTLRYALLGRKNIDAGHILENIVYLELLRRGYKVYIGKIGEKEIDFVAQNKEGLRYYQVALSTRDDHTLERELSALQNINDHYPKLILTMDIDPEVDYNGIRKMNVLDWLLDESK